MGSPKALLACREGESFLSRLAKVYRGSGVEPLVVLGKDAERVQRCHPEMWSVTNPDWKEGQYASARLGLRAALARGGERVFLHPVDIPLVKEETIVALLSCLGRAEGAAPTFRGTRGHPLLLSRGSVGKVLRDRRAVHMEVALQALSVLEVAVADPGVLVNVNTPEIYQRVFGVAPRRAKLKRRPTRRVAPAKAST